MRAQSDSYSCGIYCVLNAFEALGRKLTKRSVQKYTGTSKALGTNEMGIKSAIIAHGGKCLLLTFSRASDAIFFLRSSLGRGNPVIICTEEWDHWICVVGMIGDRFVVFDSKHAQKNRDAHGTYVLNGRALTKIWKYKKRKEYFGISVWI